jgi:hypothetical protein
VGCVRGFFFFARRRCPLAWCTCNPGVRVCLSYWRAEASVVIYELSGRLAFDDGALGGVCVCVVWLCWVFGVGVNVSLDPQPPGSSFTIATRDGEVTPLARCSRCRCRGGWLRRSSRISWQRAHFKPRASGPHAACASVGNNCRGTPATHPL